MEKRVGRREGYIAHLLSHAGVVVQLAVRVGTSPTIRKVVVSVRRVDALAYRPLPTT